MIRVTQPHLLMRVGPKSDLERWIQRMMLASPRKHVEKRSLFKEANHVTLHRIQGSRLKSIEMWRRTVQKYPLCLAQWRTKYRQPLDLMITQVHCLALGRATKKYRVCPKGSGSARLPGCLVLPTLPTRLKCNHPWLRGSTHFSVIMRPILQRSDQISDTKFR
jgi:hypothetical protein